MRLLSKIFSPGCSVFLIAVFLFFGAMQNFVSADQSSQSYKINKEFFKNFSRDFSNVLTSPKEWRGEDAFKLAAVLGTGFILYTVDPNIDRYFHEHQDPSSQDMAQFFSVFGHGAFVAPLIGTLYAAGEITDRKGLRKTALLCMESWLTAGSVVLIMKYVSGRARPYAGDSSTFRPFSSGSSYYSFPSGHASTAFAVATVLADQSQNSALDILVYSLASFAAVSRIQERKHWASDVFIGSAIGYFVGKKISALHRVQGQDSGGFQVGVRVLRNTRAITLSFRF